MNNIIPIKKGSYTPDIEIKGRTLVNALGRFGNPIYKQCDVGAYGTVKYVGDYATIENPTDSSWITTLSTPHTFIEGEYYICLADIQLIEGEFAYCGIQSQSTEHDESNMYRTYEKNVWVPCVQLSKVGPKLSGHAKQYFALSASRATAGGPSKAAFKNARIYKINKELYDLYLTKTREELDALYPYVDDVKCVVNPYIESNENLINYHLWNQATTTVEGALIPSTDAPICGLSIKCKDGPYSLKIENLDTTKFRTVVQANNGSGWFNLVHDKVTEATFVKNNGRFPLIVAFRAIDESAQTTASLLKELKNNTVKVTLVKGNTPKNYEECHNSRIMFETNLYDGETITRHNDGSYIKNSEYGEVKVLPNNITILNSSNDFKITNLIKLEESVVGKYSQLVRYDGSIVTFEEKAVADAERFYINSHISDELVLVLPNTLTGWGKAYTPTKEEISAFFLGWRMYESIADSSVNANPKSALYNGTGIKCWRKLWCGVGEYNTGTTGGLAWETLGVKVARGSNVGVCPTTMNDLGFTPYKLIYKKSNPVTEEVKTYGSLLVKEDVDVTAGSGLVLNEMFGVFSNPYHTRVPLNRSRRRAQAFLKATDDNGLDVPFHENYYYGAEEIEVGKPALIPINSNDIKDRLNIDYLIYATDTVSCYDYYLHEPVSVKDALEKMKHETTNCFEELAKTKKELESTKIELSQRTNPNLLINGDFKVWQRGTQFSGELSNHYTADRWATSVFGSITGAPYSSIIKSHEKGMYVEITRDIGQNQFIEQRFENIMVQKLKGNHVTLSCKYSDLSLGEIAIGLNVNGSYTRYMSKKVSDVEGILTFTTKLPDNLTSFKPFILIQSKKGTKAIIEWIKLELGEYATPFIPRPYAEELELCQRFYQIGCAALNASTTVQYGEGYYLGTTNYPVEMRAVPTVSIKNHMGVIGKMFIPTRPSITLTPDIFQGKTWEKVIQFNSKTTKFENGELIPAGIPLATYYQLDAEIY